VPRDRTPGKLDGVNPVHRRTEDFPRSAQPGPKGWLDIGDQLEGEPAIRSVGHEKVDARVKGADGGGQADRREPRSTSTAAWLSNRPVRELATISTCGPRWT
jgi:hypothetical protein